MTTLDLTPETIDALGEIALQKAGGPRGAGGLPVSRFTREEMAEARAEVARVVAARIEAALPVLREVIEQGHVETRYAGADHHRLANQGFLRKSMRRVRDPRTRWSYVEAYVPTKKGRERAQEVARG